MIKKVEIFNEWSYEDNVNDIGHQTYDGMHLKDFYDKLSTLVAEGQHQGFKTFWIETVSCSSNARVFLNMSDNKEIRCLHCNKMVQAVEDPCYLVDKYRCSNCSNPIKGNNE